MLQFPVSNYFLPCIRLHRDVLHTVSEFLPWFWMELTVNKHFCNMVCLVAISNVTYVLRQNTKLKDSLIE